MWINYQIDNESYFVNRFIWLINLNNFDDMEKHLSIIRESKVGRTFIATNKDVLRQKKQMNLLLDGLNLAGIRIILQVDGLNYYQYLKPNRVMFSVHPIRIEDGYRKKNYRSIILTKYILEAPYLELSFEAHTKKDWERISSVIKSLPEKARIKLQEKQIPIVVKNHTNYWNGYSPEWNIYNLVLINDY